MVKYKTLFRVLQKLVGVLICALGAMSAASSLRWFYMFNNTGLGFNRSWWTSEIADLFVVTRADFPQENKLLKEEAAHMTP